MRLRVLLLAAPLFALALTDVRAADDENPAVKLVKSKVKDPTQPFTLLVHLKVKAGQEKAFEDAFGPCLLATRKEPGCITYELNKEAGTPSSYVMYERFKSVAALEEHVKAKHVAELFQKLTPLLDGDLKVTVYVPTGP